MKIQGMTMKKINEFISSNTQCYSGTVHPDFSDVAHLFSRLQAPRIAQGGASLVVYFKNEKVVDIYTGKRSIESDWDDATMAMCYSTGKGILATLAHIIVSEGFLTYHQPISDYWPAFAQQGKEKITLADVLAHRTGLFDIRGIIENAQIMNDWDAVLNRIELAKPRFKPTTEYAYQALTFGWLVGGILEKATGKSLNELMLQYLVEPLELDGAYFGTPLDQLYRIAKPFKLKLRTENKENQSELKNQPSKNKTKKVSLADRLIQYSGQNPQDFIDAMVPKGMKGYSFFDDASLQSVIPAANGVFTARSLAKIYAMMANYGQWDSQQFIDPLTFKQLSQIQTYQRDRVMPIPMHWRLGYHRVITLGKRVKHGFGHMGYNGSGAWCDPERKLSFAYTHNFPINSITGDYRLWGLSQETLRSADKLISGKKGWF